MALRLIIAAFLVCCPSIAVGELSGHFYLEKSTFAPGEPVFLYFQVVNDGPKGENFHSADPYSFCSGYEVSVSGDPHATSSCAGGFGGSCLSSSAVLLPGQKHVERLLLNFDHEINAPGDYSVQAERHLSHAIVGVDFYSATTVKAVLEVHTALYFRVDQEAAKPPQAFQDWVDQLHSVDPIKRSEAARTLASVAPRSLEDTLLAFADNSDLRQFAPLAFHRLNTPRSMAALAELLRKTEPGTYEHMKSADYLAQSDDPQWFPLLLEIAQKNARISNYVDDAAELGGDRMLPTLVSLARSRDDEFARINAVTAMGSTGSRAAVPILLDLLRNPNHDIADRARLALRLLTHRTASDNPNGDPQSEYPKWSQWWVSESATAPIYKAKECGDFTPLL